MDTKTAATANRQVEAQAKLDIVEIADIQLAFDEVYREHQVRERCFPRWVKEGRLSKSDANDRLGRQKKAMEILYLLLDSRGADMPDSVPF